MGRIFSINLILGLFIYSVSFAGAINDNSLLWRVSGNGLSSSSYLYGTMHSKDRRVFHFADSVMNCFERCNGFAMEVVLNEKTTGDIMKGILLDSTETLKTILSASQYDSLDTYCKKHLGTGLLSFEKVKPIYLMFLLQREDGGDPTAENGNSFFLDEFLQHLAEHQLKEVYPLEKATDQLNVFNVLSTSEQVTMLMNSLRLQGSDDSLEFEKMINDYTGNNLSVLNTSMEDIKMPPKVFDLLYTKRNNNMADKIDSISHVQPVFFAFGAGHLGGSQGIIALLRKKGFTVEPVLPTYNRYQSNGWYTYSPADESYAATFPEVPWLEKIKAGDGIIVNCLESKSVNSYRLYSYILKKNNSPLSLNDFFKLEFPTLTNFKALKTKPEKEAGMPFSTNGEIVYSRGEDDRTFITFQNKSEYFVLVVRGKKGIDEIEKNKFLESIKLNPS